MKFPRLVLAISLLIPSFKTFSQKVILLQKDIYPFQIGNQVEILTDTTSVYTPASILQSNKFTVSPKKVFNSLLPENNIWMRFGLKQPGGSTTPYILSLQYANISHIEFYTMQNGSLKLISTTGNAYVYKKREDESVFFNFQLNVPNDSVKTYYLHIRSNHPVELPLIINTPKTLISTSTTQTLIIGLYAGLILSILLYNLFLFFAVKDRSYIYYVIYLFFLLLAQLTISGWTFKYLWPESPAFNRYAVLFTSSLTGMSAAIFAIGFLHVKSYSKFLYYSLIALFGLYAVCFVLSFKQPINTAYIMFNVTGLVGGLLILIASGYVARKGYRPAYYYFIAWFIFAIGREILSFSNFGILPRNNFTTYILYIGSAIEAILLSLALADRINILQKDKEASQLEALEVLKENERLVKDQNIILEKNVAERTEELIKANHQLNDTLISLKDAQAQLVDAEKMASLGQLTAGIAHEINNPINFVKSNINPLKLDIKDIFDVIQEYNQLHSLNGDAGAYKQQLQQIEQFKQQLDIDFIKNEVGHLIQGIEDGAERTAEIVRGLRTFSRLDESELKVANIHDGIDSTIVLIRNNIPFDVQVIKHFNATADVECYPGKLNQVFMNIITNGLQAISAKTQRNNPETITITTRDIENNKLEISIKDSGIGMSEDVKHRVFEPFFTTKDVGEGTGLGMAIVFKIIEKHHGKITINSSPGNGAEFILTLPRTQPIT